MDWEFLSNLNTFYPQADYAKHQSHPLSSLSNKKEMRLETNVPEENVSTSISDLEIEQQSVKPSMPRLHCPECLSKLKGFQYNNDSTIFMCENIQCNFPFKRPDFEEFTCRTHEARHAYLYLKQKLKAIQQEYKRS